MKEFSPKEVLNGELTFEQEITIRGLLASVKEGQMSLDQAKELAQEWFTTTVEVAIPPMPEPGCHIELPRSQ